MDPSNNNAFDSFGNNAGAGNGASVGGASAGAGIGSGATITSPNTGATNSGSIVSSGATAVNNEYTSNSFPEGGLMIGGDKKRSRKGLIIAGIVLFVLAIGGGLAALAAMNGVFGGGNGGSGGGNSNNGSTVVIDENVSMEVAFNRYANYLVSGETKDEKVESDIFNGLIMLDTNYNVEQFVTNASRLYDIFISKIPDEDVETMPSGLYVWDVVEYWQYLMQRDDVELLDEDVLFDLYVSDGIEYARGYIKDLNDIDEKENYQITSLKDEIVDVGNNLVEYWDMINKHGCIVNKKIDYQCVSELLDENIKAQWDKYSIAQNKVEKADSKAVNYIVEQAMKTNNYLFEVSNE